jgi:hypothetical protein
LAGAVPGLPTGSTIARLALARCACKV